MGDQPMKSSREGRLRICLELPIDIYYGIQKGALDSYTTMTNYVMRALIEKFEREGMELNDADRELFAGVMVKKQHKKVDKAAKSSKLKS